MNRQPPLYYRTKEQIAAYCAMPVEQKIHKMQMEMELMYYFRLARSKPNGEAGSMDDRFQLPIN